MDLYKSLVRPVLFSLDPEVAHNLVLGAGRSARFRGISALLRSIYDLEDDRLAVSAFGLSFRNPVGLAAGLDKDCRALELFGALGFGHIEIGTVTGRPQPGNDRPRIFRLPQDRGLINRMGFPSDGADSVAERLSRLRGQLPGVVIGANLGKTKSTPLEAALDDYTHTFTKLSPLADYFVLNVSSPNTPELRKLQEKPRLIELFRGVQNVNTGRKPLLVKIAPDLSYEEIDDVIDCCTQSEIAGIIATNTTISRPDTLTSPRRDEAGGLSGAPLRARSLEIVRHIARVTGGKLPIVGVGGIMGPDDALAMRDAGAVLVQIYTGLIYEGPGLVKRIKSAFSAAASKPPKNP